MARRRSRCGCRCLCRSFFLLVFLTSAALVTYDIYLHGSYKASHTKQLIEEKGVTAAVKAAFFNVFYYFAKVWLWLIENLPKMIVEGWYVSAPYRELLWELLVEVGQWLVNITAAPRQWVRETTGGILKSVESLSPGVYGTVSDFLGIIWEYLVWAVTSLFSAIIQYSVLLATYLRDHVFVGSLSPENILQVIKSILSFIPNYIRTCVEGEDVFFDDDAFSLSDDDDEHPTPKTRIPPPTPKTTPPPPMKQQAPPPPVKQQTPPPPVKQQTPPPQPTQVPQPKAPVKTPTQPPPKVQPKVVPVAKVPEPVKKTQVPVQKVPPAKQAHEQLRREQRPVGKH